MGKDQLLTVLPNVVSFSKSLPVLETKQSFSVGLSVFKNWADQIETESSSSLVSGAVADSAWKTIISYQKFAKCVASILVPAVFLVELTNSVHLATLKIAKSLVVSESGPPFAVVALCDMPLSMSATDIKTALGVFGSVTYIVLKPADIWQYVIVYFEKLDSAMFALNY
ncbi:hypothetical protein G9A89_018244 [Geosiphon pyriformis]|nr:hypothetical protein G9A89_018244 [Geosiphon pyriformis]